MLVAAILVTFKYFQAFARVWGHRITSQYRETAVFVSQVDGFRFSRISSEISHLISCTPIEEIIVERNRKRTVRSETLRRLSITRVPIIIITGDYYVVYRPWNLIITK